MQSAGNHFSWVYYFRGELCSQDKIQITNIGNKKKTIFFLFFSGPRTRASPQPKPLFGGENSYIDDYYTGDIFAVFEEADNFENAFIMFYAPWDADCIRSAKIIEAIAKVFIYNDIYFAVIK